MMKLNFTTNVASNDLICTDSLTAPHPTVKAATVLFHRHLHCNASWQSHVATRAAVLEAFLMSFFLGLP